MTRIDPDPALIRRTASSEPDPGPPEPPEPLVDDQRFASWLVATLRRPAWQARAACRGVGPDLFFVSRGDYGALDLARSYCARCPVVEECRDHALGDEQRSAERFGLWGATTEQQRRRLRKARRLAVEVDEEPAA